MELRFACAPNLSLTIPTTFFNGQPTNGTWYLFVRDLGPLVTGVVNTFDLSVQYDAYTKVGTLNTTAAGNFAFAGQEAGLYELIPTNQGKAFTPSFKTFSIGPAAVVNFTRAN